MADRLTSSELDSMQKSVSDMTDLSRNLRAEFTKIKNTTDLLSSNFKKIITDANTNLNIAEKYLIAQKTSNALSEKINELKSKSSYLDSVGLKFKKEETELQMRIAAAQIRALQSNLVKAGIDNAERLKAIESLKIQNVLRGAELRYNRENSSAISDTVNELEKERQKSEDILNNIELIRDNVIDTNNVTGALKSSFNFLFGRTGLIIKDLGKLGEYIQNGVTPATLVADIIKIGYENFKAFDKAAVSVRSNLGVLPGQAKQLESLIKQVGIESMHLGATFDDVAKSMNAIADEFNRSVAEDTKLVTTTTALAKQFGITEAVSAKFLKTIGGISGKSTSSQRAMIGFAQKMAAAAGVPLAKIMQDVSEATDDVRIYIGASATSMIKAATAARMMGIDLNKAAASAQKLLDFESSIASELKASALLGQNINFNYARQLFFNKNIIAANKEILRLTKQVNFNQLDPIKQKAFADAAGKTVGELQDMLTTEKNMQLVANSTDKNIQKRYQDYQRLMQLKAQEAEDEGKIAEQEFLRKANQEKLLQIQNRFNQLMSQLAEPVMEVTEFLLDIATDIMPYVIDGIRMGIVLFKSLSVIISKITTPLASWVSKTEAFIGPLLRSRAVLLSIGKIALSTLGFIGKWLNPIGWVITAFQSIAGIFTQWKKLMSDFEGPIWDKILLGIYAISSGIIKGLLGPFDFVIDKLDKIWFGKSPSMVGKNILKGITSIGPGLQDSLTSPINSAYSEIEKMSPPEIGVENTTTNKLAEKSDNALISAIQTGNQQLAAKIDQLITMMANGGIAVNIDGQLINRALSTTSLKSGGFGQATTRA